MPADEPRRNLELLEDAHDFCGEFIAWTRRDSMRLLSWPLISGLVGCSRSIPSAQAADLQKMTREEDLAILSLLESGYRNRTELQGRTIAGTPAGAVVIHDRPHCLAVSPDGAWIAWDNPSALPKQVGSGAPLRLTLATPSQPPRTLVFDSYFGGRLALSANAEHVALVRGNLDQEPVFELVVVDGSTGRVERDVTPMLTRRPLSSGTRLALSSAGDRLLVASSEWTSVLDLAAASGSVLTEVRSWNASLSPNGRFLAFVDQGRRVNLIDLSTRSQRVLLGRWQRVSAIGAWSPNGRYLLVGLLGLLSNRLVALDVDTGQLIDLHPLGTVAGHLSVWIKSRFLSGAIL